MYQYLTRDNIYNRFESSKTYTDSLTTPFPEYQRIAANKPKARKPDMRHLPDNTDGTTASIVQKTPRRIVQQVPTGTCETNVAWLDIVSTFILFHEIVPNANSTNDFIDKLWDSEEGKLTRGYSPIYCPIVHEGDYIGPDWINPWWGDVYIQPGKLSDKSCKYIFLRSWWREEDIEALIDKVKHMDPDDVEASGWDVTVLEVIKSHEQTKDDKAQTPTDKSQAINQRGGIELITGFQVGVGSQFITFHRETHSVARVKVSKDPRGKLPINFNYCQTTGTNPFGRGFVELVAPLQNLIDADDQMYQFNRALMLAPPTIKRGTYSKSQLQMVPNAIWDLGSNQANTAETVKIDSTALANYPALYQLNQSRLFQLLNAPSNTIPAGVGGVQNSKTSDGVKQTNAVLSIDDNYLRKKFESAFADWAETAINLWFAEHVGTEELQLDDETAEKLRILPDFQENLLGDNNKLRVNYDSDTDPIRFKVDFGTSEVADNAEQMAIDQQAATLITPQVSYYLAQEGWKFDTGQLYLNMLSRMKMENIDKVLYKMKPDEAAQAKQQPFPIIDPPQVRINSADIPQSAMASALSNAGINVAPDQDLSVNDAPIDMGEIYKDPSTPATVKAQILAMAGMQVDPATLQDMQHSEATDHMAKQAENIGKVADVMQAPDPQQVRQEDMALQQQQMAQKAVPAKTATKQKAAAK
jgi:hypothetical protein